MFAAVPLTVLPLVLYNMVAFGAGGAGTEIWSDVLFSFTMPSGVIFAARSGDLMVAGSIVLLFLEILKATRTGNASLIDHMMSMICFVAYLVEFLLVGRAAHPVFATLTVVAFIDVVAGFSITIRGARRDVGWG